MSFKRAKCIAKNFIYLFLIVIFVIAVATSGLLIIEYIIGELGTLIFLSIILVILLIWVAFDMCR